MERATVIMNPNAGQQEAASLCEDLVEVLSSRFSAVEVFETSGEGDATDFARYARQRKDHSVFVVGGDGTVSEALRGLVERLDTDYTPRLGIIPTGTGNGFARTLGLPHTPQETLEALDLTQTTCIDLCYVNDEPFIHTVTIGSLPEGIRETPTEHKRTFGFLAYVVGELRKLGHNELHRIRITHDGIADELKLNSLVGFSSNSVLNALMRDQTRLDDGFVHFVILKSASFIDLLRLSGYLVAKRVDRSPLVTHISCKHALIESLGDAIDCGIDGDDGPALPITVDSEHRRLQIYGTVVL